MKSHFEILVTKRFLSGTVVLKCLETVHTAHIENTDLLRVRLCARANSTEEAI